MKPRILTPAALAAFAAAALLTTTADAATIKLNNVFGQSIMLNCAIRNVKEIVITNGTTAAIAAGTPITFDAVRLGDNGHYGRTVKGPLLPPGASFTLGGEQSSSCTAWYRRQLMLAPVN